jgi:hypothetical protein
MLYFPLSDLDSAETRAKLLVENAKQTHDWLTLRQLWCLLRNEEMTRAPGDARNRLKRLRDNVAEALADLEGKRAWDNPHRDPNLGRYRQLGGRPNASTVGWRKY